MKKRRSFTIGEINVETKNEFKAFLRGSKKNEPIEIYFNSWGGNSYVGMVMEGFIYYLKRYKSYRFIMKGHIAASAAFRIFIRGDEREITANSIIQPHLPEPNNSKDGLSLEAVAREQKKAIELITKTLPLVNKEDIVNYNNFPFPLEFMVRKKIVTKVVHQL